MHYYYFFFAVRLYSYLIEIKNVSKVLHKAYALNYIADLHRRHANSRKSLSSVKYLFDERGNHVLGEEINGVTATRICNE